jgi:CYTH domain-containing protein|tara:strand:+ start:146 stop:607 length:462 start_codon:yes stop_codon:yes gene_type:complete
MPLEIERKFLVVSDDYRLAAKLVDIKQAYLSVDDNMAIRIRVEGIQASINIKSKKSERVNHEFEYVIPLDEAQSLIKMSPYLIIEKTRYLVEYKGKSWEVDEFHGDNEGLTVAEIELDEENEEFDMPSWLGDEVTADYRYLNSSLAKQPFRSW